MLGELQGLAANAAKSGLKVGDTIIYTSSFFGEELWPADSPSFVQTALARAPSPVYIKYVRHRLSLQSCANYTAAITDLTASLYRLSERTTTTTSSACRRLPRLLASDAS